MTSDLLARELRCQIELMRPHDQLPTEQAIARDHGVSYSTVRRVTERLQVDGYLYKVQGRGTFVAERRKLSEQRLNSVVYADPWIVEGNTYFVRCMEGILDEAERCGYRLQVMRCPSHQMRDEEQRRLLETAALPDVVGLILPWCTQTNAAELRRVSPDIRLVTMTARFPPAGVASSLLDYDAIGFQAYDYLARAGCQRPVIVGTNPTTLLGAQQAHAAHGTADPVFHRYAARLPFQPADLISQLRDMHPDGIAFDDDLLAHAALDEMEKQEARELRRCRLITLANAGNARFSAEIARLTIDSYEQGVNAVKLLHRMITEQRSFSMTNLLPPTLEMPS